MNLAGVLAAAQRSEAAYIMSQSAAQAAFEALGYEFLGQYQDGSHQAVISRDANGYYVTISGTRFSDDQFGDLGDDLDLRPVSVGNGALVTRGAWEGLTGLWLWALPQIPLNEKVNVEGHSLGGWRTRYTPLCVPANRIGQLTTFESPKGANQAYWSKYAWELKDMISVVNGRDLWVSWPFPTLLGTHWTHPPMPFIWLRDQGFQMYTPDMWPGGRFIQDHDIGKVVQKLKSLVNPVLVAP